MKFPKFSLLDAEQKKIYMGAPVDGTILVMGPPGTGKTIIAFYRAETLAKKGQKPRVVMYNNVLSRYTENRDGVARAVKVSTLHAWIAEWWKSATGYWKAPSLAGSKFDFDWNEIQLKMMARLGNGNGSAFPSWGHLIIDEGQDFPSDMYVALHMTMALANARKVTPRMAISVMADENQRLASGRNSTLDQIRQNLGLHADDKNVFLLKRNYRNTEQIAKFARQFYVGLPTGIPDLPTRKGSLPTVSIAGHDTEGKNLNAFCQKIVRFAKINSAMEIGVLVPNNKIRKSAVNRLTSGLDGTGIRIQTYASGEESPLEFDTPSLTVLNFMSAKGLEFDAVFVIDPGQSLGGSSVLEAKMLLYVMCSRAREILNLMLVNGEGSGEIQGWLPDPAGCYEPEAL